MGIRRRGNRDEDNGDAADDDEDGDDEDGDDEEPARGSRNRLVLQWLLVLGAAARNVYVLVDWAVSGHVERYDIFWTLIGVQALTGLLWSYGHHRAGDVAMRVGYALLPVAVLIIWVPEVYHLATGRPVTWVYFVVGTLGALSLGSFAISWAADRCRALRKRRRQDAADGFAALREARRDALEGFVALRERRQEAVAVVEPPSPAGSPAPGAEEPTGR